MGQPSAPTEVKLTPQELYDRVSNDRGYYDNPETNFRKDIENAFEFKYFPLEVKNKIHQMAWEDGHSAGYHEVITQYFDLVDLAGICLRSR